MRHILILIGEPNSEEYNTSREALTEKIGQLKSLNFSVRILRENGNVVLLDCDSMTVQSLQSEWFVNTIEEDSQYKMVAK
jgi:hypothetical protein